MNSILNILTFSFLKGIGPRKVLNFLSKEDANLLKNDVAFFEYLKEKYRINNEQYKAAYNIAYDQLNYAEKNDVSILTSNDPLYPELLRNSIYNPGIIFVKGNINCLKQKNIGIIGTRHPTDIAKIITQRITAYFSKKKYTIISGLALGCDTIAHQEAINNESHTIAVLAHGLDTIAPKQNTGLANEIIINNGALISTFPFFTEPKPYNFASRDKIQAALTDKVLMIQSGKKGGSLIASRAILELNRKLIVPYPPISDLRQNSEQNSANIIFANAKTLNDLKDLKNFEKDFKYNCKDILDNIIILKSKEDYCKIF